MPPSAKANFTSGNLRSTGDHSNSAANTPVLNGMVWIMVSKGERGMNSGELPKWNTMTVSVSWQACHAGSHSSPWWSGSPKRCVSEWKETAWQPLSAIRRISSAIHSGPRMNPDRANGMKRPGYDPAPLLHVPVVVGPDHACRQLRGPRSGGSTGHPGQARRRSTSTRARR